MQEEVENRTVNFAISTSKLTATTVIAGVKKLLAAHASHKAKVEIRREKEKDRKAQIKAARKVQKPTGKQTVKQLIGQNAGVTSIDIAKTDLRGFEKYARTFGVDYAITKDNSGPIPKYLCFFKARDTDAMTAAFKAYSAEALRKEKAPSVLKELKKLSAYVKALPGKEREHKKEREKAR